MQYKTVIVLLLIFCAEITLVWLFHILVGYVFTSLVISPYCVANRFIRNLGGDAAPGGPRWPSYWAGSLLWNCRWPR